MTQSNTICTPATSYLNATGKIPYNMMNDYMFQAILQKNQNVLKGLIPDFQPFPDNIEFYSLYKLLNIKNNHLYSDKFALGVIDLTHIGLATQEDKAYQIDHWARLFKSTTWEEIKMIAENNKYMEEALQALYECNADDVIREQCLARVEQLAKENYYLRTIEEQAAELAKKEATLTEIQAEPDLLRAQLTNFKTEE